MSSPVIKRALISVSDKQNLIPFARALHNQKVEILSTGGTLKALQEARINAKQVDEFTGFPEILDGRVKTLHPMIHGGLLYRRDLKSHVSQAKKHKIKPIDLVVVNLYPFEEVTAKKGVSLETAIENIDIGGPSMLRSAAKNHDAVTVVTDPDDYDRVLADMKKNDGATSDSLRRELALKVFERTASYDAAISGFLSTKVKKRNKRGALPNDVTIRLEKKVDLRYGENPQQRAAFYMPKGTRKKLPFKQLHGKELSYNNMLDIQGVIDILREFDKPAACVVKHSNPSGVAEDKNLSVAMAKAIDCDSLSAFGGILGVTRKCSKKVAEVAMEKLPFFEVFIAPSFDEGALKLFRKKKNLRIIETGDLGVAQSYDVRFIEDGALLQDHDAPIKEHLKDLKKNLKFVTKKKLKPNEVDDLIFAWKCVKTVKSNAIVLTQGKATVGIGAGQMSRVDSVLISCRKAGKRTKGSYLASDAFFPMPDSIEEAAKHGIKAVIQPGGSIKDQDVIDACDRLGIAMAVTGARHFKH